MAKVAPKIELTDEERTELNRITNARTSEQRMVKRAAIVLLAAEGQQNKMIAARLGIRRTTVALWRNRFRWLRMDGLFDKPGRGSKPVYDYHDRIKIIRKACEISTSGNPVTMSDLATELAEEVGISRSQVNKILNEMEIKPHRIESWLTSHDPEFEKKEAEICGLYLNPPENALVISVDEKTGIQALSRKEPDKPIEANAGLKRDFEYQRNGTASLFAALFVQTGEVIGCVRERHTRVEFIEFLELIKNATVPHQMVHLIVDNLRVHKTSEVVTWLNQHLNFKIHFTPTHASWLNQVEIWFSILGRKLLNNGLFQSVDEMTTAILEFIENYNLKSKPFAWTYKGKPLVI